jgi:hypothetical protein
MFNLKLLVPAARPDGGGAGGIGEKDFAGLRMLTLSQVIDG